MFGQALDGLVMNTTFVDISKPTPPDEEYTWNGKYSLRDGNDPRNGEKVPPGNYKVFVSIDGKTPGEGDKLINVMGVDLSIEGVDDDKEKTIGGFVGLNNDDDNGNGTVDSGENPVIGEDDLIRLFINQVVNTGKIVLRAEKNGDKIALWKNKEKNGTQIILPQEWTDLSTVPTELWVEGIIPSASADNNVELVLEYYEGGNKVQDDKVKITVMKVDLDIYNGQAGSEVVEDKEESIGAFTVANLNDTDGDGIMDKDDNSVKATANGRDEVDLMQLIIRKPEPDFGENVKLKVISGDVKLWEESTKETEILLTNGTVEFPTSTLPKTLWVEALAPSSSLRDIVLELEYRGCRDTVKGTGIWAVCTGIKHENSDSYADWPDIPTNVKNFIDDSGGFGLRYDSGGEYRNVITFQFTVYPSGIGAVNNVKFDITRQIHYSDVTKRDGLPDIISSEEWPSDIEMPNDDTWNGDESSAPSAKDHMYCEDRPSGGSKQRPESFLELNSQNDFKEFMRIRLDGTIPLGETVQGSRCSDYTNWHCRHLIIRDGVPSGGVVNTNRSTGDTIETNENDIGPNLIPVP